VAHFLRTVKTKASAEIVFIGGAMAVLGVEGAVGLGIFHETFSHHVLHISHSNDIGCATVTVVSIAAASRHEVSSFGVTLSLHDLEHLNPAILLDELISTHIPATDSDDELTVDDLGEDLLGTEEIFTYTESLDR
jgi:hypothetical protein